MANEYFVRCHYGVSEEVLREEVKKMEEKFDDLFVVREIKGRPHIHAYIKTPIKDAGLRKLLKAAFRPEGTGNAGLSVKTWNPAKGDLAFRYMCKGESEECRGDQVVVLGDKMGRMVKELHDAYWDQREASMAAAASDNFIDRMIAECKSKNIRDKLGVIRLVRENKWIQKKGFDKFMILKLVWPVYMGVNDQAADDFDDQVYQMMCG